MKRAAMNEGVEQMLFKAEWFADIIMSAYEALSVGI